jgi:hypothetical protein
LIEPLQSDKIGALGQGVGASGQANPLASAQQYGFLLHQTIRTLTNPMNERVKKLKTPEECAVFEKNVTERGRPDLAVAARKRALELRAESYGANSDVERSCLEAVYAYERVLSAKNGRTTRASRTWQMIERHGIIGAVERAVNREAETIGYTALLDMGLEDYAFEAVVVRNPNLFTPGAVKHSQSRIDSWKKRP